MKRKKLVSKDFRNPFDKRKKVVGRLKSSQFPSINDNLLRDICPSSHMTNFLKWGFCSKLIKKFSLFLRHNFSPRCTRLSLQGGKKWQSLTFRFEFFFISCFFSRINTLKHIIFLCARARKKRWKMLVNYCKASYIFSSPSCFVFLKTLLASQISLKWTYNVIMNFPSVYFCLGLRT